MKYYQIKELATLTGTTVRSLQYYDEIDLLKPSKRTDSGYRLYTDDDLLSLQQIITLKYLGLTLLDIKMIIKKSDINLLKSLHLQTETLLEKANRAQEAAKLLKYIASQLSAGQNINWESTANIITILEKDTMHDVLVKKPEDGTTGSELGKPANYDDTYNPDRLYPIPRAGKRNEIGINSESLPFSGFDCWNHYEVSWLNNSGKPIVATAEIYYGCESPYIVESKSLKLYFNSFNNSKFDSFETVTATVKRDLEKILGADVVVAIHPLDDTIHANIRQKFSGICLDDLDITCDTYTVNPNFLSTSSTLIRETIFSDLLKSNCLVTNQPDWGSVQISYEGPQINREGLLRYLVSFRNHNEFHEQCIERIFIDLMNYCKPSELTVYGRYTRRGGLDINPYRSTQSVSSAEMNVRLLRQ